MSVSQITIIVVASLLMLIFLGFPIAFCLLAISVVGIMVWVKPAALISLASSTLSTSTADYLIALPMFIFMAAILEFSGLGAALYEMMYKWTGGLRGGLAIGTIIISTIIAAMSGAAATSTVTLGMLAYPEMRKRGYSKDLSIGCIPAGGCLGPLIPPSIPMIIVAGLSSISIGKLFISGIFPGLLTAFFFIVYIYVRCRKNPAHGPPIPFEERPNWGEKLRALKGSVLAIILVFLVLGLIYLGVSTPSEAGGVGAFGALVCAGIYRKLNFRNIANAVTSSLKVTTMVFWLMIGGAMFSLLLGQTGVTKYIGELVAGMGSSIAAIAIMMLIVYVLGMFIDAAAISIICIPIFAPIVRLLGIDPLWFGLIFVMNTIIGYITPPFGVNMFYFKGLGYPEVTMGDIYRSCAPYVAVMTLAWFLCIFFPAIATWLPSMMMK